MFFLLDSINFRLSVGSDILDFNFVCYILYIQYLIINKVTLKVALMCNRTQKHTNQNEMKWNHIFFSILVYNLDPTTFIQYIC